ncbi:MAG: hypothetical protein DMG51_17985, partial [Acidobacteria bacterium]
MIPAQFRPPREALLVDSIHMNKRRSHAPHQQQIHKIRASNQQHHAHGNLHLLSSTPEMAGTIAANSKLVKRGGERVHQKWLLLGEYRAEVQDEVVVLHAGDYRD